MLRTNTNKDETMVNKWTETDENIQIQVFTVLGLTMIFCKTKQQALVLKNLNCSLYFNFLYEILGNYENRYC